MKNYIRIIDDLCFAVKLALTWNLAVWVLLLIMLNQPVVAGMSQDEEGIWASGRNVEGQLGIETGDEAVFNLVKLVKSIDEEVKAVVAGEHQSYFLSRNGKLWATGSNEFGQLGDGTTDRRTAPVEVVHGTNVHRVFAGKTHGLFVKDDNTLWAMGRNDYGQLGDGLKANRTEPIQITGEVKSAAGGESHTLFIKNDGSLWAVGRNHRGQLGDGTTEDKIEPVKIDDNVSAVFAGWQNSYYIKDDGTLWATGDNSHGVLGIGEDPESMAYITSPVQVVEGTNIAFITVMTDHMLFVKENGQLWSVGRNDSGQLGNGLTNNRNTPVKVQNGEDVISVSAGDGYSMFVRSDSTLWATGEPVDGRMTFDGSDEQKLPIWAFNRYKGDVHNHSSYTWSHGSHRTGGNYSDLEPGWDPPPGTGSGPEDYPTVLDPMGVMDPNYYNSHNGPQVYQMDRAKNYGPKYEFYVTADHCHENPFHPVDPENNPYWQDIRETSRNTRDDSEFVGMSGMEFSRNSDPEGTGRGHQVYINTHDYVSAMHEDAIDFPALYEWLKTARPLDDKGHVVLNFAHPGRNQYNDWAHWDPQIVDIATLCEITTVYRGKYLSGWNRNLNKGWKTSPTGVQDSHGYWNLENRPPLTNVLATELSTESITRAFRQRRTYVSWTGEKEDVVDNDLRYSVNGHIMGSTLDSPDTFDFHIEVTAPENRTSHWVRRIQIVRNHPTNPDGTQVVAEKIFEGSSSKVIWKPSVEDSDAVWFYLKVHHWMDTNMDPVNTTYDDLGSTYSAPTWTGRGDHHGDGSHAIHHEVGSVSVPVQVATNVGNVVTGDSHTFVMKTVSKTASSIDENHSTDRPSKVRLFQNYPNPFNPETRIEYLLPDAGKVHLGVFDTLGRKVATLVDEYQHAGLHNIMFDASELSSGIYLYRIQSGAYVDTKKMTIIK